MTQHSAFLMTMTIHISIHKNLFFSQVAKKKVLYIFVLSHSVVSNSLQPHGLQACQVPLSVGFSRQEYGSGLLCPPPGDLPDPGLDQTHVSCIADRFFTISATQKAPVYLLLRLKNPFILFTLFLNLGLSVFPSNSLIFCRILPFSSDMCLTSPSLRNFFNT